MKLWKMVAIVVLPIALVVFLIAAPVVGAGGHEDIFVPQCTLAQIQSHDTRDCTMIRLPTLPFPEDYNFTESVSYYLFGVGANLGVLQCHFHINTNVPSGTGRVVTCVNEGYKFVWGEPICRTSYGNQTWPSPCE